MEEQIVPIEDKTETVDHLDTVAPHIVADMAVYTEVAVCHNSVSAWDNPN